MDEKKDHVFVFQGGGSIFSGTWDLTGTKVVGASAGALTAVLMVCGVDAEKARKCAVQLCDETKVWDRWLKLIGIWGDMVGVWLDRLLPDNAADLCNNRVYIRVSQLFGHKKIVSQFATRQELIRCMRASTHIPFLMDY